MKFRYWIIAFVITISQKTSFGKDMAVNWGYLASNRRIQKTQVWSEKWNILSPPFFQPEDLCFLYSAVRELRLRSFCCRSIGLDRSLARKSVDLLSRDHLLLDEPVVDSVCRLRTLRDPVLHALAVDGLLLVIVRIEGAENLEVSAALRGVLRLGHNEAENRNILASDAL